MYITTYAMFRTVECHEIHVRCFVQNIDGGFHVIIYSRRIGNQSHTFTFQAFEVLLFQHFDAGLYFYFLCVCHAAKGAEDTENEMFFHNGYLYGSFINLLFLAVFGVYPPVGKDGDYHGGNAACDYHPEEVGIADSFLNVTGKHARNHHAQRHECGADSIV